MNLFVLFCCPFKSAEALCDEHVRSQAKETAQILYSALILMCNPCDDPITDGDGNKRRAYKLAYPNHPVVLWVAACLEHFTWVLNHGRALCDEFERRFGKKHLCSYHMDNISRHTAWTCRMGFDEAPAGPFTWLSTLTEKQADSCEDRLAVGDDAPDGCSFGMRCMEPEFHVDSSGGVDSLTLSYRKFYVHKAKRKFAMHWRGELHAVPPQLKASFDEHFPDEPLLHPVPRKRKRVEE
jgi:hypothetical protein